ncbi:MAG: SDR family oxidoreductase [Balneolaceae bacterium]|nr:SDR family oxidoreductase [Balneolaceae bacterium]
MPTRRPRVDCKMLHQRTWPPNRARYNIQVNGIGPGYFATSQTEAIPQRRKSTSRIYQKPYADRKWGDPSDLAGAAVFAYPLASDFINGHILYVDGGILATIGKPVDEDQ